MSENSVMYTAGCSIDITLEDFKVRSCVLHRLSPGFVAPTPDEIRFVRIKLLGWPQTKLGAFLGYPIDKKGCSTVLRWERPIEASNGNPPEKPGCS